MTAPLAERHPLRAAAALAFVTILGPIIGSIPVYATFLIGALQSHGGEPAVGPEMTKETISTVLQIMLFVTLFSYMFGGVQALLVGLWTGFRTWASGTMGYVETAFAAVLVSALVTVLFLAHEQSSGQNVGGNTGFSSVGLAIYLGVHALFAALVCRWLMERLGIFASAPRKS